MYSFSGNKSCLWLYRESQLPVLWETPVHVLQENETVFEGQIEKSLPQDHC